MRTILFLFACFIQGLPLEATEFIFSKVKAILYLVPYLFLNQLAALAAGQAKPDPHVTAGLKKKIPYLCSLTACCIIHELFREVGECTTFKTSLFFKFQTIATLNKRGGLPMLLREEVRKTNFFSLPGKELEPNQQCTLNKLPTEL